MYHDLEPVLFVLSLVVYLYGTTQTARKMAVLIKVGKVGWIETTTKKKTLPFPDVLLRTEKQGVSPPWCGRIQPPGGYSFLDELFQRKSAGYPDNPSWFKDTPLNAFIAQNIHNVTSKVDAFPKRHFASQGFFRVVKFGGVMCKRSDVLDLQSQWPKIVWLVLLVMVSWVGGWTQLSVKEWKLSEGKRHFTCLY